MNILKNEISIWGPGGCPWCIVQWGKQAERTKSIVRSPFSTQPESPIQCPQGPTQPFLVQFLPPSLWFHFQSSLRGTMLPQGLCTAPQPQDSSPEIVMTFSHTSFRTLYKLLLCKFYPDLLIQHYKAGEGAFSPALYFSVEFLIAWHFRQCTIRYFNPRHCKLRDGFLSLAHCGHSQHFTQSL